MDKKKEILIVIGIDVSKDSLDIAEYDGSKYKMQKIQNNIKSISRFKSQKEFIENKEKYLFVMEATGVYSLLLTDELYKDGFKVAVINPFRIKKFADMKMIRAKTDAQDSKTIALYGYEQPVELHIPRSNEHQELIRILKSIEDFENVITVFSNQLKAFEIDPIQSKLVLKTLKNTIKTIKKNIETLETELYKTLCKIYPDEFKKVQKIKGVGKKTTAIILAFFGKFETFETAKQVVSFIGTNPRIRDSGSSVKGKGNIEKKGNKGTPNNFFFCPNNCKLNFQKLNIKQNDLDVSTIFS
ncbi:MAG: transposase [Campylobacterota bacterium]|nr:transposase [Campylobacterota bacterium]